MHLQGVRVLKLFLLLPLLAARTLGMQGQVLRVFDFRSCLKPGSNLEVSSDSEPALNLKSLLLSLPRRKRGTALSA